MQPVPVHFRQLVLLAGGSVVLPVAYQCLSNCFFVLKGQPHDKLGEIRVWDGSLGPN
jgi:hypothetical protein